MEIYKYVSCAADYFTSWVRPPEISSPQKFIFGPNLSPVPFIYYLFTFCQPALLLRQPLVYPIFLVVHFLYTC